MKNTVLNMFLLGAGLLVVWGSPTVSAEACLQQPAVYMTEGDVMILHHGIDAEGHAIEPQAFRVVQLCRNDVVETHVAQEDSKTPERKQSPAPDEKDNPHPSSETPPAPAEEKAPEPKAWLGAAVTELSPELREQLSLPEGEGVLVRSVHDSSTASEAEIRTFDVIHKVDATIITSSKQLYHLIHQRQPGEKVMFTIIRRGETLNIESQLAQMPERLRKHLADRESNKKWVTYIGLASGPVPDAVADQINLKEKTGVLILAVMPDSPADQAGLLRNDVLLDINGKAITEPMTCRKVVRSFKENETVTLNIIREGKPMQLQARLSRQEVVDRDHQTISSDQLVEVDPRELDEQTLRSLDPRDPNDAALIEAHRQARQQRVQAIRHRMKIIMEQNPQGVRIQYDEDDNVRITPMEIPAEVAQGGVSVSSMADNHHALTITQKKTGKHLLAKNKDGRVLYDGPIDTPEQIKALPEEIRKKVKWMSKPLNEQLHDRSGEVKPINPIDGNTKDRAAT